MPTFVVVVYLFFSQAMQCFLLEFSVLAGLCLLSKVGDSSADLRMYHNSYIPCSKVLLYLSSSKYQMRRFLNTSSMLTGSGGRASHLVVVV